MIIRTLLRFFAALFTFHALEPDEPRLVGRDRREYGAPAARSRPPLFDLPDLEQGRGALPGLEFPGPPQSATILVAERHVVEQLFDGRQAEALEFGRARGADARDDRDGSARRREPGLDVGR